VDHRSTSRPNAVTSAAATTLPLSMPSTLVRADGTPGDRQRPVGRGPGRPGRGELDLPDGQFLTRAVGGGRGELAGRGEVALRLPEQRQFRLGPGERGRP